MTISIAPKTVTTSKTTVSSPVGGAGFLKKGMSAQNAMQAEESKAQQAAQEKGKLWRFYLKDNEERRVTFLDGDLDASGMLDIFMYYEHTVFHNGKWTQFPCVAEQEPCPICESGERAALVGVFTVVDHTPFKKKDGSTIERSRRLYVAKRNTVKILQTLATKREGLAGCTFDISRSGDKSPSAGNLFDFIQKDDMKDVAAAWGDDGKPADYSTEIVYRTRAQLIELGLAKAVKTVGGEPALDTSALSDEL